MDWLSPALIVMLGTVLAALGMWLLLPRGGAAGKSLGAVLAVVALGLLSYQIPHLAEWGPTNDYWDDLSNIIFLSLAGLTLVSAVCSVTLRSPVYCAIWFAVTLLSASGVLLFQGAQFLGVATIVVYAGAILVTFLFVLMLAQPEGHAFYDRISWAGFLSATVGAVLIGMLVSIISGLSINPVRSQSNAPVVAVADDAADPSETRKTLHPQHMAGLGGELFSKHLVAIEAVGVLLFIALVGAVAIVAQEKQQDPTRARAARSAAGSKN